MNFKIIFLVIIIIFFSSCLSGYQDVSIGVDGEETVITTPEMEYHSNDYKEPPKADEKELDKAIEDYRQ